MGSNRHERIEDQIQEEIGEMILKDLKDPRIGFASVTRVKLTGDKREVRVFVSVYGSEEEKQKTIEALEHAKGYVRTEIGRRIKLRHTPEVHFFLDDSIEKGSRVMEILSRLEKGETFDSSKEEE
ncbi:MAG: 30S ribosome-binding factor RbfA [Firmicutes bacterium]|nr:30S ribosome-binding factor RbfA [Bacillota bacterium]